MTRNSRSIAKLVNEISQHASRKRWELSDEMKEIVSAVFNQNERDVPLARTSEILKREFQISRHVHTIRDRVKELVAELWQKRHSAKK